MNIIRAFAAWLEENGIATFGENLFISRAPASNAEDIDGNTIPKNVWWLKAGGGTPPTGVSKRSNRIIEVYYRNLDAEKVYDTMDELGDTINCGCMTLQDHDVVDNKASSPFTDTDLDDENQTVGLIRVTITIRKGC